MASGVYTPTFSCLSRFDFTGENFQVRSILTCDKWWPQNDSMQWFIEATSMRYIQGVPKKVWNRFFLVWQLWALSGHFTSFWTPWSHLGIFGHFWALLALLDTSGQKEPRVAKPQKNLSWTFFGHSVHWYSMCFLGFQHQWVMFQQKVNFLPKQLNLTFNCVFHTGESALLSVSEIWLVWCRKLRWWQTPKP